MVALATFSMTGCNQEQAGPDNDGAFRMEANLLMGKKLFQESLDDRNPDNVFEIKDVARKSELLEVAVKGSDDAGSFEFIWDGTVQESFPMGIRLVLRYTGTDAGFDGNRDVSLTVNLRKIVGERTNLKDYHFQVINGSKLQTTTLNPDGRATSERK